MALAGQPLVALVIDAGALEAHQGHHAPQEDVHFFVVGQLVQHPAAEEPVVGVVKDDVRSHPVHEMVEALGGEPLEEGVGIPLGAHPVHHLAALMVGFDHLIHGVDVVLPVAVDADGDVAPAAGLHQATQQGVLVAPVAGKAEPLEMLVFGAETLDEGPGVILAAVVDEHHPAGRGDEALADQAFQFLQKKGRRYRQDLLLVVAGDDDVQAVSRWVPLWFAGPNMAF